MNLGAPEVTLILLLVAVPCAIACGVVASRKGYSGAVFALLGLLLGCIGLLVVAVLPSHSSGTGIMAGSLVRFTRSFPLDGGSSCPRGHATKVHELDVKQGTPAALIDAPDGGRYWVPLSLLEAV